MRPFFVIAASLLAAIAATPARAADVHALITTALETVIEEIAPTFQRDSGNTLTVSYDPSGGIARRFRGGEPAGLIGLDSGLLDALIRDGKVLPGRTDIARTGIAICVKKGAPKPDVATPDALKRTLLAAKSVGYTNPAGGGITAAAIMRMFERLGVAADVAAKTKLAAGGPNGRVSVLVSSGEAEIGFQQLSELMSNPGVEVIGMLPPDFQQITTYSGGVSANAKEIDGAKALLKALTAPSAASIYKAKGLEPL
jgi:molybdate transport system substrate-binding protein